MSIDWFGPRHRLPRPTAPPATVVRVGLDLGKIRDFTALAVAEEERREGVAHFMTHHLERLPLGSSYPIIADRVAEVVGNLRTMGAARTAQGKPGFRVELLMDTTGIGVAVADLLRERRLTPTLVTLTGTDRVVQHDDKTLSVGKAALVSRLQVLLQAKRLHQPDTVEADILDAELADYQVEFSEAGHASFNARSGQHDDLVIALGLSLGWEPSPKKGSVVAIGKTRERLAGEW